MKLNGYIYCLARVSLDQSQIVRLWLRAAEDLVTYSLLAQGIGCHVLLIKLNRMANSEMPVPVPEPLSLDHLRPAHAHFPDGL